MINLIPILALSTALINFLAICVTTVIGVSRIKKHAETILYAQESRRSNQMKEQKLELNKLVRKVDEVLSNGNGNGNGHV